MITLDHTVLHFCRAVISATSMQDLFAHRPLSEPLDLYRSEAMDLREKSGMREVCRLLVALHRHLLKAGGIDGMEAGGFTPGVW